MPRRLDAGRNKKAASRERAHTQVNGEAVGRIMSIARTKLSTMVKGKRVVPGTALHELAELLKVKTLTLQIMVDTSHRLAVLRDAEHKKANVNGLEYDQKKKHIDEANHAESGVLLLQNTLRTLKEVGCEIPKSRFHLATRAEIPLSLWENKITRQRGLSGLEVEAMFEESWARHVNFSRDKSLFEREARIIEFVDGVVRGNIRFALAPEEKEAIQQYGSEEYENNYDLRKKDLEIIERASTRLRLFERIRNNP